MNRDLWDTIIVTFWCTAASAMLGFIAWAAV